MTRFLGASCELLAISFALFVVGALSTLTGWGAKTEGALVTQGVFPMPLFFGFLTCASMLHLAALFGGRQGPAGAILQGAASPLIAYCFLGIAFVTVSFASVLLQKLVGEDTKVLDAVVCAAVFCILVFGSLVLQKNPLVVIPKNALLIVFAVGCGIAGTALLSRSGNGYISEIGAFACGFGLYLFARTKVVAMFISGAQS
jgi:hypothetical protein